MTITEAIDCVAKCLKSGVHINYIRMALAAEEYPPQRIDTVILWAQQKNARKV